MKKIYIILHYFTLIYIINNRTIEELARMERTVALSAAKGAGERGNFVGFSAAKAEGVDSHTIDSLVFLTTFTFFFVAEDPRLLISL